MMDFSEMLIELNGGGFDYFTDEEFLYFKEEIEKQIKEEAKKRGLGDE